MTVAGQSRQRPGISRFRTAFGLYLLTASAYILASPGRIDSIDGQIRFDVTQSLISVGRPILRDPYLQQFGAPGRHEQVYAKYGAGASVAGLPLVWAGGFADDQLGETRRFLFSLTSPILGALAAPLLFFFFLSLGISHRGAALWTLASAFASMLWPAATTVLDQAQHAVLVLLALLLAHLAGKRDSLVLAAAGGVVAGLLLSYQEPYALLFPALALPTLTGSEARRRKALRFALFLVAAGTGLLLWMAYNQICFGDPLIPGKFRPGFRAHPSPETSAWAGLAGLLLSPGKSVFLYSPSLLLGVWGFRRLWHRERWLGSAILLATALHLAFVSNLAFFHGDWCWGPRYLVILLPLWALAAPFGAVSPKRLGIAGGVLTLSLVVQILGLSIVHERFFFERGLPTYFWAGKPSFYFRDSALFARPGEIWRSVQREWQTEAVEFAHSPYRRLVTYPISAFRPPAQAPEEMRRFRVFYLPRPWPLWMPGLDEARYGPPVRSGPWSLALVATLAIGLSLLVPGIRPDPTRSHRAPAN